MKYIITGANFVNKGAQSMLFICVDEIRRRDPDSEIYFATYEQFPEDVYRFHKVYLTADTRAVALRKNGWQIIRLKSIVKDCIKWFIGKRYNLWQTDKLSNLAKQVDAWIDVSGFALGEKWAAPNQELYLDMIRLAKKYKKPIYLMPQSFGGFDYPSDRAYLLDEIGDLLQYPEKIFAREKQGKQALEEHFHLTNVTLSYDMVLQNQGIEVDAVYAVPPVLHIPALETENNVAVIPNKQCFFHGNPEKVLDVYQAVIDRLLKNEKTVYLFRHSYEDYAYCEKIYEKYHDNPSVHLLDNDFSCLEYDAFVKQFDFIVCSRFHGIVHAYRNFVPAIALGWEIKYQELVHAVEQDDFVFDVLNPTIDKKRLLACVDTMCNDSERERNIIRKNVLAIRKKNCFDSVDIIQGKQNTRSDL